VVNAWSPQRGQRHRSVAAGGSVRVKILSVEPSNGTVDVDVVGAASRRLVRRVGATSRRLAEGPRTSWQFIRPFLGGSPWAVFLLALVGILTGLSEAAILGLVAHIATVLAAGEPLAATHLGPITLSAPIPTLLLVAFGLAILRLGLQVVAAYLPARLTADVLADLRDEAYAAFLEADWDTKASDKDGHLQELMTSHLTKAAMAVITLSNGLGAFITLLTLLASAFLVSWATAGLIVVAAIGLFGVLRPLATLNRRQSKQHSAANLDLAGSISETVWMAEETHVFGAAPRYRERMTSFNEAVRSWHFRTKLLGQLAGRVYQSLAIVLIVLGLGGLYLVGGEQFTALGAVVLMLIRALSYGQQAQTAYQMMNDLLPYMTRIRRHIDRYAGRKLHSGDEPLRTIDSVELRSVWFAYRSDRWVLRDVSFTVRRGDVIGIVGPSGAGKSTLVQLLLRLRRPERGGFLVNGRNAYDYRIDDWRRKVAYVPQEPRVLTDTVAENIRFFRDDVSDEDVERAARRAHVHDDILTWPDGYDTLIGQRADAVSGGQRQRLCLARALAGQPDLLVLDEPTSALDVRSERLIQESLEELRGRMTLFIVAHRLSTLDSCDRLLVLEDGVLEANAEPETLRTAENFYARSLELYEGTEPG
jgi:ATP-binding cassette, subfamily B, bacterial